MDKTAFFNLSYGVYAISTLDGTRPTGCIANSAIQVTSSPATIAVSINHDNYSCGCIEKTGGFSLSILPESVDPAVIGTLGFKSGRDTDKFSTVAYETVDGIPVVAGSCGHFICKVIGKKDVFTHTIFIAEVEDCDILTKGEPMTYSYYHKVIKGKAPKNAPTYVEEDKTEESESKYICGICGYVYDGDVPFKDLPEDYVCPICGQPKSVFKKA